MPLTEKKETIAHLKREADKWFSLFIRLRDSDDQGTVSCFICGSRHWYRDVDAAHFADRDNMSLRYDEVNVNACCQSCNRYDTDHAENYHTAMLIKYRTDIVDDLLNRKHNLMKYTRHEMQQLIEIYKAKYTELKRIKGL